MIKRAVYFFSIVATLTGCASLEEQRAYARSMDNQSLCMSWMTSHPMNQYQNARAAEIQRRGLNCWQYGNVADEQRKANRSLLEIYNSGAGVKNSAPPANSAPQGFTNCVNRGAGVVECYGPKGMARCQSIGGGAVQCY